MLTRFAPDFLRFDPLRGPGICCAEGDDPGAGGGDSDNITLSQKALQTRIRRAENAARKKFLAEYELTEDDLAELAANRGNKPEADKKPEAKPEPRGKAAAFDPDKLKAELTAGITEQVKAMFGELKTELAPDKLKGIVGEVVKGTLSERDQTAQQKAAADARAAAVKGAAEKAGVKEYGAAEMFWNAHVNGLPEAEREKADPAGFFTDLLKKHPTFGGVETKPANGSKNDETKPTPAPDKGPGFDAAKAKPAEVQARLDEIRRRAANATPV